MKKFIAMLIALVMIFALCACGNMSIGLGEYTFEKIHVDTYHYSGCLTVEKWHDNGNGIEVKTREAGSLYLAEGMYILVERECPFCASK